MFLLLIGFPILFLSWRNKGQYKCVSIIGMLIRLVQKTIIPLPLSTRLLMNVLDAEYSNLWMVFLAIIRSISAQRTNLKQLLFVHGAHLSIRNSRLVWRMQGPHFKGQWLIPSLTSSTLFNLTLMIYFLIHESILITYNIWEQYFYSADTTRYDSICTNVCFVLVMVDCLDL